MIVDDNQRVYESLRPNFYHFGIDTVYAANGAATKEALLADEIDAILMDIMLGEENGIDVLAMVRELRPRVPVIMITGYASIDTAVESMKRGAFDYVKKPLDFDRLFKVVENALELHKLSEENAVLKRRIKELSPRVYVENPTMMHVIEQASKLAHTDIPVLITGENGSGKEVVADFIHANSDRVAHKMVKINCAAFPESLLDNELFGHEKGAYTGADSEFRGVFERTDKSTLFLDEIGDMPLTIQAKILRVLQTGEVRRIGGTTTKKIDVRFVAATNKDLGELIETGQFRQDLFYRLNTAIISVPPLRERPEDLELLVKYFLEEFSVSHAKTVESIDSSVLELFRSYSWPGNVRELKNTINYGVAITGDRVLRLEDLPPLLQRTSQGTGSILNIREETERNLIEKTLHQCHFNKKRTAEILNMSRKTLYAKIARYGISA